MHKHICWLTAGHAVYAALFGLLNNTRCDAALSKQPLSPLTTLPLIALASGTIRRQQRADQTIFGVETLVCDMACWAHAPVFINTGKTSPAAIYSPSCNCVA